MINLLDIALLNCCTYSCDYCISKASTATAVNYECNGLTKGIYATNGQTLKAAQLLNFINNHYRPDEVFIQLSGGEPLLHDAFPFITEILYMHGYKVIINTNANQIPSMARSLPIDTWPVYWRTSWHRDFRNIEHFLKDIEPIKNGKLLINYVAHPKRIESGIIKKDIEDLEFTGLPYEVTAFQGKWNDKDYDKNTSIYKGIITGLSDKEIPAQECNYISIQTNGNLMRCHKVQIGNIYENRFIERYPQARQLCSYENGNTNCGLVQSLTLLGLINNTNG